MKPLARFACAVALALLAALPPAAAVPGEPLQFRIVEGRVLNAFQQDGDVAAHLLLSPGDAPRILVAFPAGNSGVGVWFREPAGAVRWTLDSVRSERRADAAGRPLRGIVAEARVDGGELVVRDAVLGSVRTLRDYQLGTPYPPETRTEAKIEGDTVRWSRDRIDGAPGYEVALQVTEGVLRHDSGAIVLAPEREGAPVRLRITALTGEAPLTPFAASELFSEAAGDDPHSRQALRFLSYHEKFLAGSWRFDTYFGRDTLMSLRLLLPALRPEAIEAGLASVLERLDPAGEVAHEEDIGEFAVLRHRREGTPPDEATAAPIFDYKMIDDDFMLAPVAAAWLLDRPEGRERARAFLARRLASGETAGAALARNFGFVLRQARAFARDPVARNLVALKPGHDVGQWRDSEDGLAGGRYAYDVNAVFVPAALAAIARFVEAGLLEGSEGERGATFADASAFAGTWSRKAPPLFAVELPVDEVRRRVREYAARGGVEPQAALASLGDGPLRFPALALDAGGEPIPVLHSDTGFALLFSDPEPSSLEALVQPVLRPFPAGLLTDVGMLVANPAYAFAGAQRQLGRNAYHGTVVWSWQQALMAAGLQRQLQRKDLPDDLRARLRASETALWDAIDAARATRTSELWSWSYADGSYRVEPFGQSSGDADESNAAQLWSTVYLAVRRPDAAPP